MWHSSPSLGRFLISLDSFESHFLKSALLMSGPVLLYKRRDDELEVSGKLRSGPRKEASGLLLSVLVCMVVLWAR